jgi:hypothetical protein
MQDGCPNTPARCVVPGQVCSMQWCNADITCINALTVCVHERRAALHALPGDSFHQLNC